MNTLDVFEECLTHTKKPFYVTLETTANREGEIVSELSYNPTQANTERLKEDDTPGSRVNTLLIVPLLTIMSFQHNSFPSQQVEGRQAGREVSTYLGA